jgi:hypothetical protein
VEPPSSPSVQAEESGNLAKSWIILGGFLLMGVKSQVLPMVIFVALKIGFDVYFHRKERAQKATP